MASVLTQELIVAGFHRSGTSLLAQLLHTAGLFMGDDLIGAMPSNPFGHFEDRAIVELHDSILADNGLSWQVFEPLIPAITSHRWRQMESIVRERRVFHPLWGFKDPRVCFFLPHWTSLMPGVKVIGVFRHPRDSIFSLESRHMVELLEGAGPVDLHRRFWEIPDLGMRMWLVHNMALVRYFEVHPETTMLFSLDALSDGVPVVDMLRSEWGLRLRTMDTLAVYDAGATLVRNRPQPVYEGSLVDEALTLWQRLNDLAHVPATERVDTL